MKQPEEGPKEGASRKAEPKDRVAKRGRKFTAEQGKRGLVRWQPWVTPDERRLLAAYLAELRQRDA